MTPRRRSQRRQRPHHREPDLTVAMLDVPAEHRDRRRGLRSPGRPARAAPARDDRARRRAGRRRRRRARRRRRGPARRPPRRPSAGRRGGPRPPASSSASSGQRSAASAALTTSGSGSARRARSAVRSIRPPGSTSPSMSAASARSAAALGPGESGDLGRDLGPDRVVADPTQRERDRHPHLGRGVARARRDLRRGPRDLRPRRAPGCSRPARRRTDRRGRRARPRPLHRGSTSTSRSSASVRTLTRSSATSRWSLAGSSGCSAIVRMSSPSRTSRSSSLSTRRSITSRLLSLLDGQVGRVERAAAEVREQVHPVLAVQEHRDDDPRRHDRRR